MSGIFICYRRDDTAGWAGRLHADIEAGLRRVDIFRDIDDIPPGVRFDEFIAQAVGSCEVLIALIGPQWLTAQGRHGVRRLDEPNDFIRAEIATGLQRDIRVIPALVGGAKLPTEEELPDDIRELARRQAYELSDSRWTADCRKLVADIKPLVRPSGTIDRRVVAAAVGAILLLAVAYGVWQRSGASTGSADSPTALSDIAPLGAATQTPGSTQPSGNTAQPSGSTAQAAPLNALQITERRADGVESAPEAPSASTNPATGSASTKYVASGAGAAGVFNFAWPGGDCWEIYRGETRVTYGCGTGKQALGAGTYTVKNNNNIFQPFTVEIRPGFDTHVTLGGVFEFKWAGGDCWDIYRGDQKVTYGCGSGKQALEPGKYTIQNGSGVFLPFEVDIKAGVTTTAVNGGVFEFKWPGGDCWDIFRGDKKVTYGCGSGKQALQAGSYTIKTGNDVFTPFDVTVKTGETTTLAKGGVFEFKWPGGDCWDIYRGEKKVTYGCGSGKQALQAGSYTIKTGNEVFTPFEVTVRNGETTTIAKGGIFEFKWPGGDCWDIYRGDKKVTYGCGSGKQALQAGRYTIKPASGPVFAPFEVHVRDGVTVTAP